ncbi:MAG TPA: M23 family metallopeptidase [Longimicrobiales bacterium]|nr:M23 family metallopeptidase [Longimicrobiales bacterium]
MKLLRAAVAVLVLTIGGCALPQWPVGGTMTSPYGLRFLGWRPDIHEGVDIAAPEGSDVRAMSQGRVSYAGAMAGYGNVVFLRHNTGIVTVYAHLSSIAVRADQLVNRGDVVGRVGRSGNASGAHLHFEVWIDGRSVDPVLMLGAFPRR